VTRSLWECATRHGGPAAGEFRGAARAVALADLAAGSILPGGADSLRGRSVLLATDEQLPTALALLELDGVARRIVLCTPDLDAAQFAAVAKMAQCEVLLCEEHSTRGGGELQRCPLASVPRAGPVPRRGGLASEWILLTSGTTGTPKLVVHTLESLAGSLPRAAAPAGAPVWSTFYDIRRYGGLQIYLRAVLSGAPLVLSSAGEPMAAFLERAACAGVTHISGTPSHWRRALMSGAALRLRPRYVRLSGEVADQPLLDALAAAFPGARIAHAFASTEAGVAFDVDDGRAGFPAALVEADAVGEYGGLALRVVDGTLRIRSERNAARYLGEDAPPLVTDGFVDTGDLVERVGERYYFRGRRGGVINVGGLKVFPEEVESVLNADPRVRMSQVRGRRSPITGAIVVADVVLVEAADAAPDPARLERIKSELLQSCRRTLPAHKVPAAVRLVPALEVTAGGKLVRSDA
jgi:acyl-coenzyme A synthetase/AMP-(fatty) acid ligase